MNNNARYDRPRHCFELEVNVPRTIAILPDEKDPRLESLFNENYT